MLWTFLHVINTHGQYYLKQLHSISSYLTYSLMWMFSVSPVPWKTHLSTWANYFVDKFFEGEQQVQRDPSFKALAAKATWDGRRRLRLTLYHTGVPGDPHPPTQGQLYPFFFNPCQSARWTFASFFFAFLWLLVQVNIYYLLIGHLYLFFWELLVLGSRPFFYWWVELYLIDLKCSL